MEQFPDSGTKPTGVPDDEAAACSRWLERVEDAKREARPRLEKFGVWRGYIKGEQHSDGAPGLVRTNLIHATLASILPHIYSKDPELSVVPTESVSEKEYVLWRDFCATATVVLNRIFVEDARLKDNLKDCIRSAQCTGDGWLKVMYQRDKRTDPLVQQRIEDTQDNIARIDALVRTLRDDATARTEQEAARDELKRQMEGLQQQVEVIVAEGIVIDRVLTEDILVLDRSVREFNRYRQARAIAHRVWMTREEYEEQFGAIPDNCGPTLYVEPSAEPNVYSSTSQTQKKGQGWVAVWEIWDRVSHHIYWVAEGMKMWARPPVQPANVGQRFFPFFRLGFNLVEGCPHPTSDTALLQELQDEYNQTRTHLAEHRKDSMPVRLLRKGGSMTQADLERIRARRIGDIIPVEGLPGRPVGEDIAEFRPVPIDPSVYDVSGIRSDIEMVSGRGDAAAGAVHKAKTATEASILQSGLTSRTEERRDTCEDLVREMAVYALEVLLQELTAEQVQRIAGMSAVWPNLPREDIYDLVRVQVKAGTTGRPDRDKEREQWLQLYPVMKQTIVEVAQMRAQGAVQIAEAMRQLLKETLRRFDERIDIDEYIPPMDPQPLMPQVPGMAPQAGAMPPLPASEPPPQASGAPSGFMAPTNTVM